MISKSMNDEVFMIMEHLLEIDISHLIDAINSKNIEFDSGVMSVSYLSKFNRSTKINNEVISNMSNARRDEPIIISVISEAGWIIDGNHRLTRRQLDEYVNCDVVAIPPNILLEYSVCL